MHPPFVRLLVLLCGLLIAFPQASRAQEQRSPSILEFFGIKPAKPKVVIKKPQPKAKPAAKAASKKTAGRKKQAADQTEAAKVADSPATGVSDAIPAKLPNAKIILTVGDFMAEGVSEGLATAFEPDADINVVDKANGSSGFVRDDFYNWTAEIPAIIAEVKPSAIVVMIGTNDRQQLRLNGNREAVLSSAWRSEYERRINAFLAALKASGVPVVWIGMPPFKQASMSADMLAFNDLYRQATTAANGRFVDVWEAFLDENGAFSINGFDQLGQPARLRASDGINLTAAGKRKIAFFVEKPLRELLGGALPSAPTSFPGGSDPFALPGPKKPTANSVATIVRTQPVSLFDPAFDGGNQLLGSNVDQQPGADALPVTKLYRDGIAPGEVPGRIN